MSRLRRELKRMFLETLAGDPPRPEAVWGLFASNVWFRAELERMAERVLGDRRTPLSRGNDAACETFLLSVRDLRRAADLHADPQRVKRSFSRWLQSIMRHGRQPSVRRWQRRMGPVPPNDRRARDSAEHDGQQDIRVDGCVCRLNDDDRWLVMHFVYSFTSVEIASLCETTPRQVRYARRCAAHCTACTSCRSRPSAVRDDCQISTYCGDLCRARRGRGTRSNRGIDNQPARSPLQEGTRGT